MEDISFEKLIRFFKKRERDSDFKGLADMRSRVFSKVVSIGTVPQGQRLFWSFNS